jgi:hypothetical protein
MMNKEGIMKLTEEYGGAWGINHSKRLEKMDKILAWFDQETNNYF